MVLNLRAIRHASPHMHNLMESQRGCVDVEHDSSAVAIVAEEDNANKHGSAPLLPWTSLLSVSARGTRPVERMRGHTLASALGTPRQQLNALAKAARTSCWVAVGAGLDDAAIFPGGMLWDREEEKVALDRA